LRQSAIFSPTASHTTKEAIMGSALTDSGMPADLTRLILEVLSEKTECTMEELLESCAPYTSNQVFLEMDRLSRTGEMCLLYKRDDDYAVSLPLAS
jgi:hypothetical protein